MRIFISLFAQLVFVRPFSTHTIGLVSLFQSIYCYCWLCDRRWTKKYFQFTRVLWSLEYISVIVTSNIYLKYCNSPLTLEFSPSRSCLLNDARVTTMTFCLLKSDNCFTSPQNFVKNINKLNFRKHLTQKYLKRVRMSKQH